MRSQVRATLGGLLVIGVVALVGGIGGYALFADQANVGANAFDTGTIDISTNPTSAVVTFSAMVPGDSVTSDLVVTNAGTEQLRYAVTSTATNSDSKGLKDELDLTIRTIDVTTPDSPCNDFDGTSLYSGDLDSGAGGLLIGDPAQGADTGDRLLNASANETLCFRVELPSGSTGPQGASTTATFTFSAEQTANNP